MRLFKAISNSSFLHSIAEINQLSEQLMNAFILKIYIVIVSDILYEKYIACDNCIKLN